MKLPQIKKSVQKFLLDETGEISKQSLLKIGVGVVMFAGTVGSSGGATYGETWTGDADFSDNDWKTTNPWKWTGKQVFEHCSWTIGGQDDDHGWCKMEISGPTFDNNETWELYKDKIWAGFTGDYCSLFQGRHWYDIQTDIDVNVMASFKIETNLGLFTATGDAAHGSHWSGDHATRSVSSTTSIKDPAGLHENSISLNATDSNTKIKATHDNNLIPIDLTLKHEGYMRDKC